MRLPHAIETPRLIMRPHLPEDHDAFGEFMTDDVATAYVDIDPKHKTVQGAAELLDYVIASYQTDDPLIALAVVDKETGAYLGYGGLQPLAGENGAECYYSLLPRYWGWGFATESAAALLFFAFEELELDRVVAHLPEENARARRVAEKVGMSDEGPYNDGTREGRLYAITREEFIQRVE